MTGSMDKWKEDMEELKKEIVGKINKEVRTFWENNSRDQANLRGQTDLNGEGIVEVRETEQKYVNTLTKIQVGVDKSNNDIKELEARVHKAEEAISEMQTING